MSNVPFALYLLRLAHNLLVVIPALDQKEFAINYSRPFFRNAARIGEDSHLSPWKYPCLPPVHALSFLTLIILPKAQPVRLVAPTTEAMFCLSGILFPSRLPTTRPQYTCYPSKDGHTSWLLQVLSSSRQRLLFSCQEPTEYITIFRSNALNTASFGSAAPSFCISFTIPSFLCICSFQPNSFVASSSIANAGASHSMQCELGMSW